MTDQSPPTKGFDKIAKQIAEESESLEPIPLETRQRYQRYWHLFAGLGMTQGKIADQESVSPSEVAKGIDWASRYHRLNISRNQVLDKYLELAGNQIPMLMQEIMQLRAHVAESGGKGIEVEEEVVERRADGQNRNIKRKLVRPHIPGLTSLSKALLEWTKFRATIEGLLVIPDNIHAPTQINVNLPEIAMDKIYTHPQNAPLLDIKPIDPKPEDE